VINKTVFKGLAVAALHVTIVASLGAKLMVDRATRPRVWARTAPVDPNLPIRGRYVSLMVDAVPGEGVGGGNVGSWLQVALADEGGQLVARPASGSKALNASLVDQDGERVVRLAQPLAYFIPEHVADPSRRLAGEQLWVEVTIPRAGAPRPIRLGVKKDGVLTPLEIN
jgi:hypothetical protein